MAKVLIAVPNLGSIHTLLVMRLLEWHTRPTKGVEQVSLFMPTGQIPHDSARNFCVQHFLNTDSTHLFFIDSDVIPPPDALERLVADDKDVVTGLYPSMRADHTGEAHKVFNAFCYGDDKAGEYGLLPIMSGEGLIKVDRAGGGCLLIKREVLEKVGAPWFRFQYHESGVMFYGEDIDFFRKAESAGFDRYADCDVKCRHLKDILL